MKDYNLLKPLTEKHYGVFHKKFANPSSELAYFRSRGLAHEDIFLFAKMAAWDTDGVKSYHKFLLDSARTNDEIVRSLTYFWKNPSESYRSKLGSILDKQGPIFLRRLDYRNLSTEQKKFFYWFLADRPLFIAEFNRGISGQISNQSHVSLVTTTLCHAFYRK